MMGPAELETDTVTDGLKVISAAAATWAETGRKFLLPGGVGMLTNVRNAIADYVWIASVRKHRSRMGWRAGRYSTYLRQAQRNPKATKADPEIATVAAQFRRDGWAAFCPASSRDLARSVLEKIKTEEAQGLKVWEPDGRYALGDLYLRFPEIEKLFLSELGDFLRAVYGCNFKIFYGICYKSTYDPAGPVGSQLWHSDGGPGSCINLMWCLSPVNADNGAMECLSWPESLEIFERERAKVRTQVLALASDKANDARHRQRRVINEYYREEISKHYERRAVQPNGDSGLLFAFSNNVIHKGGYPKPGHERYVCVFHIYPSAHPTQFERYRADGIQKRGPYPVDPAWGD